MRQLYSSLAFTPEFAFVSGHAPICWQREMMRQTARLDALRRAGMWIEALAALNPRLRDEPLVGRCLVALTGRFARAVESSREGAQSRQTRLPRAERRRERERKITPAGDHRPTSGRVTQTGLGAPLSGRQVSTCSPVEPRARRLAPFQLEPQVTRARLQHLAGRAVSSTIRSLGRPQFSRLSRSAEHAQQSSQPRAQRAIPLPYRNAQLRRAIETAEPNTLKGTRPLSIDERAVSRIKVAAVGSQDPVSHRGWLYGLAQRIWHALYQNSASVGSPQYAWTDQQHPSELVSFTDQWLRPLDGQRAAADLLDRLASGSVVASGRANRDGAVRLGRTQAGVSRSPAQPSPATVEERRSWQAVGAAPTESKQTISPSAYTSQVELVDNQPESLVQAVTPVAAVSLPPLLQSRILDVPTLSVAAALSRQGTRQEGATAAEDNLSALAAKIKRILDEEARRHGIDV